MKTIAAAWAAGRTNWWWFGLPAAQSLDDLLQQRIFAREQLRDSVV